MMADRQAREILRAVWPGRSLPEYQAMQAIGRFEGNYGHAFGEANNWGASQRGALPDGSCPVGTTATPDFDRAGVEYTACIFRYRTPEAGARALVRSLTSPKRPRVAAALTTGDPLRIARAMYASGYMARKPEAYAVAIARNAATIARALREPLRVRRSSSSSSGIPLFVFLAAAVEIFFLVSFARGGRA